MKAIHYCIFIVIIGICTSYIDSIDLHSYISTLRWPTYSTAQPLAWLRDKRIWVPTVLIASGLGAWYVWNKYRTPSPPPDTFPSSPSQVSSIVREIKRENVQHLFQDYKDVIEAILRSLPSNQRDLSALETRVYLILVCGNEKELSALARWFQDFKPSLPKVEARIQALSTALINLTMTRSSLSSSVPGATKLKPFPFMDRHSNRPRSDKNIPLDAVEKILNSQGGMAIHTYLKNKHQGGLIAYKMEIWQILTFGDSQEIYDLKIWLQQFHEYIPASKKDIDDFINDLMNITQEEIPL